MPYIKEDIRKELDICIDKMITCLGIPKSTNGNMTNEDFSSILGDINYSFSRIIASLMGRESYAKIAMITGVLENIKQEFYRRIASPYEDTKIREYGDIKEYSNINKRYFWQPERCIRYYNYLIGKDYVKRYRKNAKRNPTTR